jgi:hypothetical protein
VGLPLDQLIELSIKSVREHLIVIQEMQRRVAEIRQWKDALKG